MNKCLQCGKPLSENRVDSLGRRLTRTTKFCCKKHRNDYSVAMNRGHIKKYMAKYYQDHKEKK